MLAEKVSKLYPFWVTYIISQWHNADWAMFNNVIFTRLLYLTFDDLTFCAGQMLDHWTVNSVEGSSGKYFFKLIGDQFYL